MSIVSASPHDVMRRALAKMDSDSIMNVVDALQLQGAKISAVIAVPLRGLQKKRDVAAFAAGAPIDAVAGLLEVLSMEPLEKVISALGENAESPNYEQLSAAIASLRAEELSTDALVAVLAYAIGHEFPAAAHCRRILGEDESLTLPEIEIKIGHASLLTPKVVDESVREQRRARRAQEKAHKQARASRTKVESSRLRGKVDKKVSRDVSSPTVERPQTTVLEVTRRMVTLTPSEAAVFDVTHPLAGSVVITEVPFDNVDPVMPEQQSKIRPALVIAASSEGLLVRGIYSHASATRSLFSPWRRLGFGHVSYIDVARIAVAADAELNRIGMLSDDEWNSLL